MKAGVRVALAIGAGYFLGRSRKMRLALMIAAAGATGKMGTSPGKLVQNGLKQLGSSAEIGKLTDLARDELLGAAKSAAVTAASSRIESLNERLQPNGGLRNALPDKDERPEEDEGEDEEEKEETPRRATRSDGEKGSTRRTRATTGRTPVRRARR